MRIIDLKNLHSGASIVQWMRDTVIQNYSMEKPINTVLLGQCFKRMKELHTPSMLILSVFKECIAYIQCQLVTPRDPVILFHIVIELFLQRKEFHHINTLWNLLLTSNITPNSFIITSLMKSYRLSQKPHQACELFSSYLPIISPSISMYTELFQATYETALLCLPPPKIATLMHRLLDQVTLLEKNKQMEVDTIFLLVALTLFISLNDVQPALSLFQRLLSLSLIPSTSPLSPLPSNSNHWHLIQLVLSACVRHSVSSREFLSFYRLAVNSSKDIYQKEEILALVAAQCEKGLEEKEGRRGEKSEERRGEERDTKEEYLMILWEWYLELRQADRLPLGGLVGEKVKSMISSLEQAFAGEDQMGIVEVLKESFFWDETPLWQEEGGEERREEERREEIEAVTSPKHTKQNTQIATTDFGSEDFKSCLGDQLSSRGSVRSLVLSFVDNDDPIYPPGLSCFY